VVITAFFAIDAAAFQVECADLCVCEGEGRVERRGSRCGVGVN